MKIVVFSDSHSDIESMKKIVDKEKPNMIFHLGDCIEDALALQKYTKDILVEFVQGNTDYRYNYDKKIVLEIEGKKIFLTHGHKYHVKRGVSNILKKGIDKKVDITLFGHTHIPYLNYKNKMWLMNPGSINRYYFKGKNCSYGIIKIKNSKITCKIVEIIYDNI